MLCFKLVLVLKFIKCLRIVHAPVVPVTFVIEGPVVVEAVTVVVDSEQRCPDKRLLFFAKCLQYQDIQLFCFQCIELLGKERRK